MANYIYSKEDLAGILKNIIITGEKWSGYEITTKVAEFWQKIFSGKNHDDILLSLRDKETGEQKKQRLRLYNSRTKYVANKIITQLQEVYRSDNIFNDVYFKEKKDSNAEQIKKLNDSLKNYYGDKDVREWLRDRFLRLNMIDPNSYLVTNFKFTDGATKKQVFYPIEVRSREVLSRQYVNGDLQYLAFEECYMEKITTAEGKIKTVKGYKYWNFGADDVILYHKCPQGGNPIGTPVNDIVVDGLSGQVASPGSTYSSSPGYTTQDGVTYSWSYAEFKIDAGKVPAACVGYVPNTEDNDQTYESILYPSKELFIELIWKKTDYDIHMQLHGIAQKFAFVPGCDYKNAELKLECNDGHLTNGEICPQCHGSGQMPFHTSGQDIITISLPRNRTEIFDLSKLIYFQPIPLDVIKLGREEIRETERAISLAIFNTSIIDRGELIATKTATEIRSDFNATNNVMYTFGIYDAKMYKAIVTQIAVYSNTWRPDLVVDYGYPNDFNLEDLDQLQKQLMDANKSGSPEIVKRKITSKIISKLLVDNAMALKQYEIKEYWKPFSDRALVALLPEFDPSRIFYIYFEQIFRDLDAKEYPKEGQDQPITFYFLPYDKQKSEIDAMVNTYMQQYTDAKQKTIQANPSITVPRKV